MKLRESPVRAWEAPPVNNMARIAKKPQFEAFNQLNNCYGKWQKHKGSLDDWRQLDKALMLEVGAGTAKISQSFSRHNPNWQVIALDQRSERLYKAARFTDLDNLIFLQTDLKDLEQFIDLSQQVDLLWLGFPDPYPNSRQAKHRLTSSRHIDILSQLLKSQARLRLKTDDLNFYNYSRDMFENRSDFRICQQESDLSADRYEIYSVDVQTITDYEYRFLDQQRPICYLEAVKI